MGVRYRAMGLLYVETAIWLFIAVGMWIYSYEFDRPIAHYEYGVMSWPRVVLALLAVFAIFSFVVQRRRLLATEETGGVGAADLSASTGNYTGVQTAALILATFALPLVYVWLLPGMGFFALTPFFIAGYMYIFRQRKLIHLTFTSFLIYAALTFIFSRLLYLPLPTGYWPGFYEFGTAVVEALNSL